MSRDDHAASSTRPPNRLASQSSPYLLQHARNPVDWFPWGDEAFRVARQRDVPVFLSIGYSTCYWCHVMEHESFENEAIARQMNERFVCIKVDREERPDIDDLYMAAVQAFTGHGGWPMSVFLEPAGRKPFWAGTYFPPEPRYQGMPAFPQVLARLSEAWNDQRSEVLRQADELAEAVRERVAAVHHPVQIGEEHVTAAVSALLRSFDRNHGGFGGAPKFPQPVFLELLLDARAVSADEATTQAIDAAVRTTLDRMACGGIHDQVGGGFHRYSVDARWLVPHFEKMLYDNAQLGLLYARAARVYGDGFYRRTAVRTFDYVLREMTDPRSGAFFSAQDAEVDGREGHNYIWTREQLQAEAGLSSEDAAWAASIYGLDSGPNFRDPHHPPPDAPAANVLFLSDRPDRLAASLGVAERDLLDRLDRVNAALLRARQARKAPRLDDKLITSWNGLMIRAMALAGAALGEPRLVRAAARAADAVLEMMRDDPPGRALWRTAKGSAGGEVALAAGARIPAVLEDYAFLARGLIDLHRTGIDQAGVGGGGGGRYLASACDIVGEARRRFGASDGGYFDSTAPQADLFVRIRSTHDGAMPSGASELIHAMLDLAEVKGETDLRARAAGAITTMSADLARSPAAVCNAVRALMRLLAQAPRELDAALAKAGATQTPAAVDEDFTPVEVLATTDRVAVSPRKPGGLVARVRIADGYHLIAADPDPGRDAAGVVPFRVRLIGVAPGDGIGVFADYPAGEPSTEQGGIRVYREGFDLTIVIEQTGPISGRPIISLTYQACNEDHCLAPRTIELDVAIDHD